MEAALCSFNAVHVCVVCSVCQAFMRLVLDDVVNVALLVGTCKTTVFCDAKLCLDD